MNEKTIQNWLKLSEYDIQTASAMLDSGRYLYVAYMCQQSVEKLLKAIYIYEKSDTPPYLHNLPRLYSFLNNADSIPSDLYDFVIELNAYYIETRYSEDIEALSTELNKEKAERIFKTTTELIEWLRKNKIS